MTYYLMHTILALGLALSALVAIDAMRALRATKGSK